ncbi:hypothetical protein C8J57DRAFT_1729828 [Mycena rebaudengoi]|nr:hypothetical protein C8J57DRAFT_1729828 [Mycena rebaudengoi]
MAERARRESSDSRPGKILIDNKQKRRTAEKKAADDRALAEAKQQKTDEIEAKRKAGVQHLAKKQVEMQQEDEQNRSHAARPDIATAEKKRTVVADTHGSKEASLLQKYRHILLINEQDSTPTTRQLSAESEVDGADVDMEQTAPAAASDDDDAYVASAGSDENDEVASDNSEKQAIAQLLKKRAAEKKKGKKSQKKLKGALRGEIDSLAGKEKAPAVPVKRKATTSDADTSDAQPKKQPKAMVGGLKKNWKKAAGVEEAKKSVRGGTKPSIQSSRGSSTTSVKASGASSEDPLITGEFDEDESPESVQAARRDKAVGKTAKMGITLKDKSVSLTVDGKQKQERKPSYNNSDLPFPSSAHAADLKYWQGTLIPTLIDWVATLEDPFAANAHTLFRPTVEELWKDYFPKYEITDAVYAVASSAIRTWRSNLGKIGVKIVADQLLKVATLEGRRTHVATQLEDFAFIYQDPVEKVGAFRSEAIYRTMSSHCKVANKTEAEYGHPVGALAISCAALERAYKLHREGKLAGDGVERRGKRSAQSFVASPWATRAAGYLPQIKKLSQTKWEAIWYWATAHYQKENTGESTTGEGDESSEGPYEDPRTLIIVSDSDGSDDGKIIALLLDAPLTTSDPDV